MEETISVRFSGGGAAAAPLPAGAAPVVLLLSVPGDFVSFAAGAGDAGGADLESVAFGWPGAVSPGLVSVDFCWAGPLLSGFVGCPDVVPLVAGDGASDFE